MAIGDPYATLAEFKQYLMTQQQNVTADDALMTSCLMIASQWLEEHCNRQFNLATVESPRIYQPSFDPKYCKVDDFVMSSGFSLRTDPGGTGNFDVLWQPIDYELKPLNNIVGGRYRPYNELHAVSGLWFPHITFRRDGTVQLTALWGWESVPVQVNQACIMMAAEIFKSKDAVFGVAGFSAMGAAVKIRVTGNPIIHALLKHFVAGTGSDYRVG